MAWDRLRLMIALVVLAFVVLVVVLNRSAATPAAGDRRRWHWTTPKTAAAILLVTLGLVAVVNRPDGGDDIRGEIQECRDEHGDAGRPPWPPETGTNPPVVGERTLTAYDGDGPTPCPERTAD